MFVKDIFTGHDLNKDILNTLRGFYTNPKSSENFRQYINKTKHESNESGKLTVNYLGFGFDLFYYRQQMISEFGFSIPCVEALNAIKKVGNILEIGAGTGYWSKLLKDMGVDIISTDSKSGDYQFSYNNDVIKMDAVEAIKEYPDRNVFVSWPCYDKGWAFEAAKAMEQGTTLIYIGEGRGGCTADDNFHNYFFNDDVFPKIKDIDIPRWDGIYDSMFIGKKWEVFLRKNGTQKELVN